MKYQSEVLLFRVLALMFDHVLDVVAVLGIVLTSLATAALSAQYHVLIFHILYV